MNEKLINALFGYSVRYREGFLAAHYKPDNLLQDWWKAFEFFLGRACYQGRRDSISQRVHEAAIAVLQPRVAHTDGLLTDAELVPIGEALRERIGRHKVGKARDVDMMLSALRYIRRLPAANIVADSVARIEAGNIGRHYEELQAARSSETGIVQVGAKVAAFYLRDVVSLYDLEAQVSADFQFCLQPVDVWVRRLARTVGIVGASASDSEVQRAIVRVCRERGCSPLQFNQGAWYAGAFAFDLLLENLTAHGL